MMLLRRVCLRRTVRPAVSRQQRAHPRFRPSTTTAWKRQSV